MVTINLSQVTLNPGNIVVNVPVSVVSTPLPQMDFQTALGQPNPISVGNGTNFTSGSYTAQYTIAPPSPSAQLTGFRFVVAGFVHGNARVDWTKTVRDSNSGAILFQANGFVAGAGQGGSNGSFTINLVGNLAQPSGNLSVEETFTLSVGNAPGVDKASLLLVERDWVPEPASLLALGAGLAGLIGLRRRAR